MITAISRRNLLAGYATWMTLLVVAYYGLPGLRAVGRPLLTEGGVRCHRGRERGYASAN